MGTYHIVWADTQVCDLQPLDSMDIQSLIQDTVLDDTITFLRSHATSSQTVPSGLDMSLYPLLNVFDILFGVLDLVAEGLLSRVEPVG